MIDDNLVNVLTIKTSYRSCKIVLWIPVYKQLLNTRSSCKKLYIIKQNYMHIKHPIYSVKLCPRLKFTKPQFGTRRATSTMGPAGLTARELTKVSTDASLKSFFWVTIKKKTNQKKPFYGNVWLAHRKQATFLKPHFPVRQLSPSRIINELNSEIRHSHFFL